MYSADFNEDFSAFHAGTLKEQAEYLADCIKYIRALYSDQGDAAPSAVIVIAHSMGGIAARYMFLQEGFEFESVKTLITLSTPHTIPPATFDRGVERIYHHINTFWQESHKSVYSPLNDTLSVSLAGGIADTMISSDYADMSSLVPRSHGFSVITTSVPTLFSPVDHLAMMWCDQLRQQIISALLESTDLHRVDRTRRLDERLAIFQSHLLTGAELIPSTVAPLTAATLDRSNYEYVNASLSLSKEMVVNDSLYRFDLAGKEGRRAQVTIAGHGVTVKYYACEGPDQQSTCHLVEQPQLVNIPSDNIDPQSPVQRTGLPIFFSDVEMPASAAYCLLQISKTSGSLVQAHTQAPFVEIGTSLLSELSIHTEEQCHVLLTSSHLDMYLFGWKYDTRRMPAVPSGFAWLFTRLDNPLMVYSLSVTADESKQSSQLITSVYI